MKDPRWPKGVPADPAEALRAAALVKHTFRGNVSNSKAWVFDEHVLLSTWRGDARAVAALRATRKPDRERWDAKKMDEMVRHVRGHGGWALTPTAIWRNFDEVLVRMSVAGGGPPVVDVKVDYLRLAAAVFGGEPEFAWGGVGQHFWSAVTLVRGGRMVGVVAGFQPDLHRMCPPIEAADLIVGGAAAEPPTTTSPPWAGGAAALGAALGREWSSDVRGDVERMVRALGGRPASRGAFFTWEVPTRAGVVRLGVIGERVYGLCEEPVRVLRMEDGGEWGGIKVSPAGTFRAYDGEGLAEWFLKGDLPQAPEDRRWLRPAETYAPAFVAETWSEFDDAFNYHLVDVEAGATLRGTFRSPSTRARQLAVRLSAARALRRASAG